MTDRFDVKITATNQASAAFQQVSRDAQAMGTSVEQSGQRAGRSLKEMQDQANTIGAAAGTLIAGASLLGQSYVRQEQQIRGLNVAYGDASDELQQFARHMQDISVYSDDAARAALISASTITRQYGIATDQVDDLVQRSADLASIYGFGLTDATERVTAAIRGEAEAAEALGIAMSDSALQTYAAQHGMDGWNTTMTEAEKAQVRFQVLMQQTAYAQGAAADAADTNAGKARMLMNDIQDLGQAFGEALGPMGEYLSVLGNLALALPLVSAGIGKVAAGFGALEIGAGALGGLAAGGALSYIATDALMNRDATGSRLSFTAANYGFYGVGSALNTVLPGNPVDTQKYLDALASNSVEDAIKGLFYFSPTDKIDNAALFDRLVTAGVLPAIPNGANIGNANEFYEGQFLNVQERASQAGMSTGAYINAYLNGSNTNFVWDSVTQRYMDRGEYQIYQQARARLAAGQIQATTTSYVGSPGTSGLERAAGYTAPQPYFPFRGGPNPQADFAAYAAERQRILAQIDQAALAFLQSPQNVQTLLTSATVMPGAPVFNRNAVGGGGMTLPFYAVAGMASDAGDRQATGFRVTVGQTNQIASQSAGVASWATDLVNQEGALGKWDDLVSRGVINLATDQWANFRDVQDDANRVFAANAKIQDDVAVIQLKQLDYNADLLESYQQTIDILAQMPEEEQRRALAMMDSAEASKVNEAATIAYRVAMGELSETIGTDLIAGMAAADPLLADILEQYGLIEKGANGEIAVNFPEKQNLIDGIGELSDEIHALVDAIYTVVIDADSSGVQSAVGSAYQSLTALAGSTFYVDIVGRYSGVSPTNPTQGMFGGVLGYAHGGMVTARMAEAGPEYLRFANGGTAWAMNDGLYAVPRGTYVTPAPASKGQGRSNAAVFNNCQFTIVANDPRQLYDQIAEYARGGSRL